MNHENFCFFSIISAKRTLYINECNHCNDENTNRQSKGKFIKQIPYSKLSLEL